jgi:hypothetical protein
VTCLARMQFVEVRYPGDVVSGAVPRGLPRTKAFLRWWQASLKAGAGEWLAAEVQCRRDPATALCDRGRCRRRVRFAPPLPARRSRLGWPRARTSGVAIRCAFCLRVFCETHALEHFGVCREVKLAERVAAAVVRRLRGRA